MLEPKKNGNDIRIEGILSEVDLETRNFKDKRTGADRRAISGTIKIRVDQKLRKTDTELTTLEIPVSVFASELKNDGAPNPAYENLTKLTTEYTSIAASDLAHADRVRITSGQLRMNEYYNQAGKLISFPRISTAFISKVKPEDFKPSATFSTIFVVANKGYELDNEGVETDKYCITGVVPQWGGKVDVVKFYTASQNVTDAVSQYWEQGDTVSAAGKLNFSSTTETTLKEVDFGDPVEETRTISVSELLITSGQAAALEGEFAYDQDEITAALAERKSDLAKKKEEAANRNASTGKKGSAPASKVSQFNDLGF